MTLRRWLPLLFRALVVWQLAWPALSKFALYRSRVEHFRHDYGIPFPETLVPVVGFFETLLVLAALVGFAGRLAAVPVIGIMLVAFLTAGPNEGSVLVLLGSLGILLLGTGRLSLWEPGGSVPPALSEDGHRHGRDGGVAALGAGGHAHRCPVGGELMEQIRVYGLGPTRDEAMAALGAAGYSFRLEPGSPERPGRPHAVGRSADGRRRVELIGPEGHVFKAVLIDDLAPDVAAAAQFLGYFAPDWDGACRWFSRHLPRLSHRASVETALPRLHVHLRKMGQRDKVVLTLSWTPR